MQTFLFMTNSDDLECTEHSHGACWPLMGILDCHHTQTTTEWSCHFSPLTRECYKVKTWSGSPCHCYRRIHPPQPLLSSGGGGSSWLHSTPGSTASPPRPASAWCRCQCSCCPLTWHHQCLSMLTINSYVWPQIWRPSSGLCLKLHKLPLWSFEKLIKTKQYSLIQKQFKFFESSDHVSKLSWVLPTDPNCMFIIMLVAYLLGILSRARSPHASVVSSWLERDTWLMMRSSEDNLVEINIFYSTISIS